MDPRTSTPTSSSGTGARGWLLLAACILIGLVLRGLEAHRKSLWLDELHTLDVASRGTYAELNDFLSQDVHTPLFYIAVQALEGHVAPHALRWLAIAGSMLCIVPLLGLARAAGLSPYARIAACGIYCSLPYQIQWGAELRPYAWLELAALTATWAAFTPGWTRGSRAARAIAFATAVAFGLYTHLFMAIAVVGVGATRLVFRPRGVLSIPALIAAGLLGVVPFVPWLATTHPWVFDDPTVLVRDEAGVRDESDGAQGGAREETVPSVPDGGALDEASFLAELGDLAAQGIESIRRIPVRALYRQLIQVPLNTLVPRINSLGGYAAVLAHYGLLGLLGLLVALSVYGSVQARNRTERPAPGKGLFRSELAAVVASALVSSTLLSFVCIQLVNRLPLQYFALSAWAWPLALGALVDAAAPRARATIAALFVAAATLAGLGHALGAPREDLRRGVLLAVETARERGAWLTAVLWQPNSYAHTTPFWVYAPDADWIEPQDVPAPNEPGGEREVVVFTRSAPDEGLTNWDKWGPIVADANKRPWRRRLSVEHVDGAISIYVYGLR